MSSAIGLYSDAWGCGPTDAKGRGAQEHAPFRDSRLTRLLTPALGGNARAAVVCCLSPAADFADHRYAHTNLGSLPGGMFGSAGVPTRPAGDTGDGSRAHSGTPAAAARAALSHSSALTRLNSQ
jgi:hypothetical protein